MTTEQAEAFAQLRTLAAASRLRVRPDDEGWPVIPGRLGQIEYHDARDLAVFTDRPRLHAKLWAIPGVRRHQTGDQEMRALFPPEALEQVAGVIRTRRRRIQSPAQTQNLTKGPRSAASRPQDRAQAGTPALDSSAGPEVHTDGRPTEPGVNARFIHPSGSNAAALSAVTWAGLLGRLVTSAAQGAGDSLHGFAIPSSVPGKGHRPPGRRRRALT